MKIVVSLYCLFCGFSIPGIFAQNFDRLSASLKQELYAGRRVTIAKELNEYIRSLEGFGFSGQVLVMEKGKLLLSKGYGAAKTNPLKPINVQTVFEIASLTKQFTAAAILHLEMEGKLKTEDALTKFFNNVPEDKAAITIQQLITHTSGLPRDVIQNSSTEIVNREETVSRILSAKLTAKPGERYAYSNTGYHLLAAIIEKLSGQSF